jgi:hypothetical protein
MTRGIFVSVLWSITEREIPIAEFFDNHGPPLITLLTDRHTHMWETKTPQITEGTDPNQPVNHINNRTRLWPADVLLTK